MNEWMYLAIGAVAAFLAQRLGIPLKPSGPAEPVRGPQLPQTNEELHKLIEQVVLEVLKRLAQPKTDPRQEAIEALQILVGESKAKA